MGVVYRLQDELGRFFVERVYKQALLASLPDVQAEVPIDLVWRDFKVTRFLDILVGGGAAFEFKTVEKLTNAHHAQLLNYLMLLDLAHGKLANLRSSRVEEAFVNTSLRFPDRIQFEVDSSRYQTGDPAACLFRDSLLDLLQDWGAGLELALYLEAMTHVFGGTALVERQIDVVWKSQTVAQQPLRFASDDYAFHVTAMDTVSPESETQAQRLLDHTRLKNFLWANVSRKRITFTLLKRGSGR